MKVSLFVHNLSGNPIVRAYPIAKAIQLLGHEVEVLGLTYNSDSIYQPYKDEFIYKTIRTYDDIRWVMINSRKLARMATGDIAYAFKPLWDSFYPALLYTKFGKKRRLLLDAEDNELHDAFIGNGWKNLLKNKFYPINPVYNKILHPFTWLVKRKTVVNSKLQKRYGGIIVLHGPKAQTFDPALYADKEILRTKYNLPLDKNLLLFAGRSVFYNGLDEIIKCLLHPLAHSWHLVLAGDPANEKFQEAKNALGERCHLLGFVPNNNMPELIKMCDVVPVIQTPCPSTEYQVPAKMLEAMAMGKGIITTDVSDMQILIDNTNGWIVPYGDGAAFASLLSKIAGDISELKKRGDNARIFFLKNASVERIAEQIKKYFI